MRIIINAFQYAHTVTGTDRMAHNFLTELQKIDTTNEYFVICSIESYNRSAIKNENFKVIKPLELSGNQLLQRIYNKLWRTLLPVRLKLLGADCYFSFHNMSLPQISVAKRMIVFNLDLIPIVLPGYESIHKKSRDALTEEYRKIAERADHFISISEFSKNELNQLLGVAKDKVSVVHLAARPDFGQDAQLENPELRAGKYLLTIGGTEPRKNVETVVHAFIELPTELQQSYPLVIVGGEWHGISLEKLRAHPHIKCLGYVHEDELPGLYKNARAFVFASEYEGFGFTILEAMAAGTPVISSNSTSLEEVAGNAALLFEPHDIFALKQHIESVIKDTGLSKRLVDAGQTRLREFSWTNSAKKLHEVITDPS